MIEQSDMSTLRYTNWMHKVCLENTPSLTAIFILIFYFYYGFIS